MVLHWLQATLDFWSGPTDDGAGATPAKLVPSSPPLVTSSASTPPLDPPPGSAAPLTPSGKAKHASLFYHALATHQVQLLPQGHPPVELAYRLERAKRRSIAFVITEDGLKVKAPQWVSLTDINSAMQTKALWIVRKIDELQTRTAQSIHQRFDWEDGAVLQFLGQPMTLVLDPTHSGTGIGAKWESSPPGNEGSCLLLPLPHHASPQQIRDTTKAWLMRQASTHFKERLDFYAPQLGVRWTRLTLSNAGTRWGSAKIDGSIRLHWRLIHFKPSIIDYVVVHELSHLRVMNHSPQFWDTVATLVPDYAAQRKQLRTQALPKWE